MSAKVQTQPPNVLTPEERMEKRFAALLDAQKNVMFVLLSEYRPVEVPEAPDWEDAAMAKRTWETHLMEYRKKIRAAFEQLPMEVRMQAVELKVAELSAQIMSAKVHTQPAEVSAQIMSAKVHTQPPKVLTPEERMEKRYDALLQTQENVMFVLLSEYRPVAVPDAPDWEDAAMSRRTWETHLMEYRKKIRAAFKMMPMEVRVQADELNVAERSASSVNG
jgi:hypothetical protein